MSKKYKALVTDPSVHAAGIDLLQEVAEVTVLPKGASQAQLEAAVAEVDGILVRTLSVTESLLKAAPNLKIVARHGVGYDNVDLAACTRHGVVATITAQANAISVSEYALGLMLSLSRKIVSANGDIRGGLWDRSLAVGGELHEKVVGIIGFGRVGSRLARLLSGFEIEVLTHDPYIDPAVTAGWATPVDLATLISRADYISLHVPLNAETHNLIGAEELAQMKSSAILINTSRGGVVDEAALYQALRNQQIVGAALDVFEQEPLPADFPLAQLPNCLCTPHSAGQSTEALVRMAVDAATSILRVWRGEMPELVINPAVLPQLNPALVTV